MEPKGHHYIVEASKCNKKIIGNIELMQQIIVEAANKANTKVWAVSFHRFPPNGVSGVVVISESHLSVHTWPEVGYVALDIYTCGKDSKPEKAVDYIIEKIEAEQVHVTELSRGLNDGDNLFYHSIITWEEDLSEEE